MPSGSCLCGKVSFDVACELPAATACHCSMCRKQSGHFWASANVPRSAVAIRGEEHVTWYGASEIARRGFCSGCGSFLFWERPSGDAIGIGMGAFDGPTGTGLGRHIFVADKGDYYDIADGVPQRA